MNEAQLHSWLVVAAVTASMFGLIYGIVARGSRLIESQRASLNDKVETLSQLLHQNQTLRRRLEQATRRTADLNERHLRRISAELHDGPAQLLAFASLRFDSVADGTATADEASRVRTALAEAMRDIRNTCRGLTLPELADLSVSDVLSTAVAAPDPRPATEVTLVKMDELPNLSQAEKICIYRFVQEALNNATRHAGGKSLSVTAKADEHGVTLAVADKGPGFDRTLSSEGLGLIGLEERIAGLGGSLSIETAPDRGTILTMKLSGLAR